MQDSLLYDWSCVTLYPIYTMQLVVQPVWQPAVSCKRGFRVSAQLFVLLWLMAKYLHGWLLCGMMKVCVCVCVCEGLCDSWWGSQNKEPGKQVRTRRPRHKCTQPHCAIWNTTHEQPQSTLHFLSIFVSLCLSCALPFLPDDGCWVNGRNKVVLCGGWLHIARVICLLIFIDIV